MSYSEACLAFCPCGALKRFPALSKLGQAYGGARRTGFSE